MMKLVLVLLVLVSRELVTADWRFLLTRPSYWWLDVWLKLASRHAFSAPMTLWLLSILPVIFYGFLLLLLQHSSHLFWQFLWGGVILVSVFIDRRLPTVLAECRQKWVQIERVSDAELDEARYQLFATYLKELFAPLFWILLLGVWGVLLVSVYYSCRICVEQKNNPALRDYAERILWYLDWLPSRAVALSFALVGQFSETWSYWRVYASNKQVSPLVLIEQAAQKAERINNDSLDDTASFSSLTLWMTVLAGYEALCFRTVVLWVILLVIQTL